MSDLSGRPSLNVLVRVQAYAKFLCKGQTPNTLSIGPLYDVGATTTAVSIGETLNLLLKEEDSKLLQLTEGNEALQKALGLK